jgi:integral membrane protein
MLPGSPAWEMRGGGDMMGSTIGRLRLVGLLEGLSFLVLLGIAMPLKYLLAMPLPVRVVGLVHGVLFIAFVLLVFEAMGSLRWSAKQVGWALLASLLPFGTLVLDRRLKREAQLSLHAETR